MSELLSYERFLEFEKAIHAAVSEGRMNEVAGRDSLEHVKKSTEAGIHDEARLHVEMTLDSLASR